MLVCGKKVLVLVFCYVVEKYTCNRTFGWKRSPHMFKHAGSKIEFGKAKVKDFGYMFAMLGIFQG
jgi:hypothetical protein